MNDEIAEKLRHKGLSESSIKLYLSTLRKLNWGQPIENLNYLRKTDEIVKRMDHLADSTRKQMLISVISVLSLFPKFKNVQQKYYKLIQEWNKAMDTPSTTATETQRKNWIDWEQVLQEFENLRQHALSLEKAKKGTLTAPQYAGLLQAALLGLYVLVPPHPPNEGRSYKTTVSSRPPTAPASGKPAQTGTESYLFGPSSPRTPHHLHGCRRNSLR